MHTLRANICHLPDMFERCRSAGLGGAVVLKQRAEDAGNAFVVGRIDRVQYDQRDVARFGDRYAYLIYVAARSVH